MTELERRIERKSKWAEIKKIIKNTTLQNYTIRGHVITSGHVGLTGLPECKQCWPRNPKMKVAVIFQPNEPIYNRGYINSLDRRVPDQAIILTNEDMDDLKHYMLAIIHLIKCEK